MRKNLPVRLLALALSILLLPAAAHAATCSNPTGTTGAIIFNTDYSVVQVCNTSGNWIGLGGNSNDGSSETDPQVGGLTAGKWCTSDGTQITCNSDEPTFNGGLTDLSDVTITTPSSGQVLTYNGSAWVNSAASSASGDQIISDTTSVTANETGYISLTTAGVTTGYFNTAGLLVAPGISLTSAHGISSTNGYFSGSIGIGTTAPSATLDVSGKISSTVIQLADSPSETCTLDTIGTIRVVNGVPQICRQ